ncbi:hypothetical protein ATE49_04910 [Elizabethkingia miricola]|uniref:Uncharacterized protein DUF3164 n=1 Tax=Elizabethkingia miricola TaxID=172045 RepID=A0ABY3NH82_ELIMR|nr:DUF3164 family protein [Elizabethkingia miricola]OBS12564.1 hypothetical protein ATE49_04910 [Elizabethkingia miricola]TYO91956.1 uncharacterized protein DUF3164 [Elizabethkingia miricola]
MSEVKQYTTEELEALLAERKQQEAKEREDNRIAYEELRAETVKDLFPEAEEIGLHLTRFRDKAFTLMYKLYEVLQSYSKRHKDGKGSCTIEVDDMKIILKKQGKGTFDERSNQAEQHIIDFINNKFGGDADTRDFIMLCLERKNGALDIDQVQKLYSMEDRFDDPNWKEGIKLLKESYSYKHSKDYIRFERRNRNGQWIPIILNFSYAS